MDEFIDERDGSRYNVVRIGDLLWLAENLKYQGVPHCFPGRNSDNIQKYGCLYTWEDAIKACPDGWHLPTKTDFNDLLNYVDNHKSSNSTKFLSLIANPAVWKGNYSNKSVDEFGFAALPAGNYRSSRSFNFDFIGRWWSATEDGGPYAYYLSLGNGSTDVFSYCKTDSYSVRCVKEAVASHIIDNLHRRIGELS